MAVLIPFFASGISTFAFALAGLLALGALALAHHWIQLAQFSLVNTGYTFLPVERTLIQIITVYQLVIAVVRTVVTPLPWTRINSMPKALTPCAPIPKLCFCLMLIDAPLALIPVWLVTAQVP